MGSRQQQKGEAFRALHERGTFVIANAWDAGSARVLTTLGFPAIASTSSGFAFGLGRADGSVALHEVAAHARVLDEATDLPVAMDLENGYGPRPADAALAVTTASGAGAVGGSIEDFDPVDGLYPLALAAERVAAAAQAARALDVPFVLTARAENHIRGNPALDDTITRMQAYEEAGADVLFAPGLRTLDEIRAVCEAVARPVNVLAPADLTVAQLAGAGVRRISVGGRLALVAYASLATAASRIRDEGAFDQLGVPAAFADWL
ncbi:isocitrate lyase/phosphoenolpyruvate mutase family protein [Nocardioides sp. KR10-350]|uniref:isocitrate lyase/PEP mutase family protein n=1 Tax=Nocardioides cheoyonin TaxID=3156615 RepID=UPI0032B47935